MIKREGFFLKISKILCFFLIFSAIFNPFCIRSVQGASKPGYVGIDVNDVLVWKVAVDDDPFEDYLEDSKMYTEGEIDNITDLLFSDSMDEDVKGWKMAILDIKSEKEFSYDGGVIDGVIYRLNWYTTEDYEKKEWGDFELNARGGIASYEKDFYAWRSNSFMGLFYMIVANNIKWDKVVAELNEELDDEYDGDEEEGSASTVKSLYEEVGISIIINEDGEEYEDFKAISKFNDDGVLMYYEWSYDGEPIIILELDGQFFHENWEVIVIVAQVIGVLAVAIVVIKKIRAN